MERGREVTTSQVVKAKSKVFRHAPPPPPQPGQLTQDMAALRGAAAAGLPYTPPSGRTRSRVQLVDFPCVGLPRGSCSGNVDEGVQCRKCEGWAHLQCAGFPSFVEAEAEKNWVCHKCLRRGPPDRLPPPPVPLPSAPVLFSGLDLLASVAASPQAQLPVAPLPHQPMPSQADLFATSDKEEEEEGECPHGLVDSDGEDDQAISPSIHIQGRIALQDLPSPTPSTNAALANLASPQLFPPSNSSGIRRHDRRNRLLATVQS
jgi:hypothetical protein